MHRSTRIRIIAFIVYFIMLLVLSSAVFFACTVVPVIFVAFILDISGHIVPYIRIAGITAAVSACFGIVYAAIATILDFINHKK
jgi:hypothetical protein